MSLPGLMARGFANQAVVWCRRTASVSLNSLNAALCNKTHSAGHQMVEAEGTVKESKIMILFVQDI